MYVTRSFTTVATSDNVNIDAKHKKSRPYPPKDESYTTTPLKAPPTPHISQHTQSHSLLRLPLFPVIPSRPKFYLHYNYSPLPFPQSRWRCSAFTANLICSLPSGTCRGYFDQYQYQRATHSDLAHFDQVESSKPPPLPTSHQHPTSRTTLNPISCPDFPCQPSFPPLPNASFITQPVPPNPIPSHSPATDSAARHLPSITNLIRRTPSTLSLTFPLRACRPLFFCFSPQWMYVGSLCTPSTPSTLGNSRLVKLSRSIAQVW